MPALRSVMTCLVMLATCVFADTAFALPSIPTGLTATAGDTTATAKWNAASGASNYVVRYCIQASADCVWLTDAAPLTQQITGLTNGTAYEVAVRSLDAAGGKSDFSAAVVVTPKAAVVATGCGSGSCGEVLATLSGLPKEIADTSTPQFGGVTGATTEDTEHNRRVYDVIQVGNTIYAGGAFTTAGGQTRNRLAAFNATTGALLAWNPNADGDVRALAASPDGKYIFAGGEFAKVGGVAHARVAKIDAATGAVQSWSVAVSSNLYGLASSGTRLYISGTFTSVGGVATGSVAAVNISNGAVVTTWVPKVTGGSTRAVKVSNDGKMVYIGGTFTKVGTATRTHIAAVDATTGVANGWAPTWPENTSNPQPVFDMTLSPDTTRLYVAVGGSGANGGNRGRAFDPTSGHNAELWHASADGDHNAVAASATHVYLGGHFDFVSPGNVTHHKAYAVSATTGVPTTWDGGLSSITGTYAITVVGNNLIIVGSNSTPRNGLSVYRK